MNTFRRRNGKNNEYSGYNDASEQLRNRILNCTSKYIGEPSPYSYGLDNFHRIYRSTLNELLDNEYGVQNVEYTKYIKQGNAEDVFTAVEHIIHLGHAQLYNNDFIQLIKDLAQAFSMSGSVYEINRDGQVGLKLDENTQESLNEAEVSLSEFEEARQKYQQAVVKLISRGTPEEVVQDAYLALEKYIKIKSGATGKNAFSDGINNVLAKKPIQREIVKKLAGFKGNAKDISHDGNYKLDVKDALWYLRSVGAIFSLLEPEVGKI